MSQLSGEFKRDLVSSFNANLILPLYSVFLPLLAYALKASAFEVGLVGGAANAVYCFMPFVMGHFADRGNARRFFVTTSFVLLSVISISYIYVQNPATLIVTRIFEGVGWAMLWPAIEAAIRDSTTDARRALSIFNLTWSSSAAVGPLIGSIIVFVSTIREAFVVSSAVMIVTLLLNLAPIVLKRSKDVVVMRTTPISDHVQTPRYGAKLYVPSMILAAITVGVLYTFLPEYAKSIHVSILLVGVATFTFGFARFLVYLLTTKERLRASLLHSRNRARNVVISLVIMSLSSLLMFVNDSSGLVYVAAAAIGGACFSVVYAVSQASIIAEAAPEKVGRSAGMFESSIGIGQSLGPVIGGAIAMGSYSTPFVVPSLSLVVFLVALPLLVRRRD